MKTSSSVFFYHGCALLFFAGDVSVSVMVTLLLISITGWQVELNYFLSQFAVFLLGGFFARIEGQYTRRIPYWNDLFKILRLTVFMASVHGLVILFAMPEDRSLWLLNWLVLVPVLPMARMLMKKVLIGCGLWKRNTVILGGGKNAIQAAVAIADEPLMGYKILSLIGFNEDASPSVRSYVKIRDTKIDVINVSVNALCELLKSLHMPHVIVSLSGTETDQEKKVIEDLMMSYRNLNVIPALPGLSLFGAETNNFFSHDVLMLRIRNNLSHRLFLNIKRIFDVCAAFFIFALILPLLCYVAFRIWLEDGGPVIFYQERMGLNGKKFRFYKFRSMVKNADAVLQGWKEKNDDWWVKYKENNFKLSDDPRVLKVGRWIRSSSIDELPQLWNVIRGDMSLVGPRPLLPRELDEYGDSFDRYYAKTLPGITGLWQVSGRSETTFSDRVMLDAWYVRNWNLWYDIAILFKTISVVFMKKGAM